VQITDLMGSLTFAVLAVLTMVVGAENDPLGFTKRRITLTAIIVASRTELALFLWYRVIKRGKDARFDEIRSSFWVRVFGRQLLDPLCFRFPGNATASVPCSPPYFVLLHENYDPLQDL
jgi:steroid 5-alpha reductase family enzyme